ncbi:polyamine ABC transporter substrate-binding protein [Rhodobacter veldkampii DSM 11550]|uniref:Polyamine ABC transporter substrate-binding protein n=1 Tax=Phaeovulum veldkampii DSM 11550 TaxID=1185920 RepID=A0A2T4JMV1_9RHOB|nr:ABC transporter substrate-binding protein [Phaeovulum veldkampii]MBK5947479.1 polyamine ABC transporter substrate-binding protein [Phaeovulum veldkampii DSM 11550]PTE19193.1 polyamine ABC transporter substrate-binding protein [Phaeovulum veldkampii DSM 11550]TDQ62334.1 spermidine/putrescine transport system substrate-binding protein [Phaeovulum veldkampii DSM 11550]
MKLHTFLLASAAALALSGTARAADPELLVFDWAGFEVEGLFADYKAKHGDAPTYTFYGDDDEAFQKVASGFKADVAHPCSQMVSKYRDAGLIEPWDVSRIPAFDTLAPKFLASPIFKDDQGVWYIPTDWGATAVAYNTEEVPAEDVATLQVFTNPKYAGRTSLPDSSDDVWALAYLATGVTDWTTISDEQFAAAAAWLREAHQNVAAYWADPAEMSQLMASGAVQVAWSWNDGVVALQGENYPVGFQREATEGSSSFFCGFVNLKDGPGSEDKAYDFINSWLRPEAAPALLEAIGYGHTSTAAMDLISDEELVSIGLNEISAPVLAQTPNDPALRERQLAEFEKIKAGF